MDKLYRHILTDIIKVSDFRNISNLFCSNRYITMVTAKTVKFKRNKLKMAIYNLIYIKRYDKKISKYNEKNHTRIYNYIHKYADGGNIKIIKYLANEYRYRYILFSELFSNITDNDDLVKYLCDLNSFGIRLNVIGESNNQNIKSISISATEYLFQHNVNICFAYIRGAKYGNLELIKWLDNKKISLSNNFQKVMFQNAIESSNLELVQYLWQRGYRTYNIPYTENIEILKYLNLKDQYTVISKQYYKIADQKTFFQIMEYLRPDFYNNEDICDQIVRYSSAEIFKDYIDRAHRHHLYIFDNLIRYGNAEKLKYYIQKKFKLGYKFSNDCLDIAIKAKNIEVIKYMHENGVRQYDNIFDIAAKYSNPEILELLKNYGYRFTDNTSANAGTMRNVDNLVWLYKNNCPKIEEAIKDKYVYKHVQKKLITAISSINGTLL